MIPLIKLSTQGKPKGIYALYDKESGLQVCKGTKEECAKFAEATVKNLEYHYYKQKKDGESRFKYYVRKVGEERKNTTMMGKEDFIAGLMNSKEVKEKEPAAEVVGLDGTGTIREKETAMLKPAIPVEEEKESAPKQPKFPEKVVRAEAKAKAFDTLVPLILAECGEDHKLYWFVKGMQAFMED